MLTPPPTAKSHPKNCPRKHLQRRWVGDVSGDGGEIGAFLGGVRRYSCGGGGRRIQETLARRRCSRAGCGLCYSGSPRRSLSGWDWRIGFKCSLSLSFLLACYGRSTTRSLFVLCALTSHLYPLPPHPPTFNLLFFALTPIRERPALFLTFFLLWVNIVIFLYTLQCCCCKIWMKLVFGVGMLFSDPCLFSCL